MDKISDELLRDVRARVRACVDGQSLVGCRQTCRLNKNKGRDFETALSVNSFTFTQDIIYSNLLLQYLSALVYLSHNVVNIGLGEPGRRSKILE